MGLKIITKLKFKTKKRLPNVTYTLNGLIYYN